MLLFSCVQAMGRPAPDAIACCTAVTSPRNVLAVALLISPLLSAPCTIWFSWLTAATVEVGSGSAAFSFQAEDATTDADATAATAPDALALALGAHAAPVAELAAPWTMPDLVFAMLLVEVWLPEYPKA